jgi:hypothetical protein
MKWQKLGKVFAPTDHSLPAGCREFAQAPQALVFPDRVRVYFSTREREPDGKYLSRVAFVDLAKDLSSLLRVSQREVLPLGALGCFDEHGIFPMNVLRRGDLVYGYTCGWSRRVSVSVETAIGLAISSDDGLTFERVAPGPILGPSPQEPFLVGDPFVIAGDGHLHMWYIFGTSWRTYVAGEPPERIYKIGHAVSADGISWEKEEGRQVVPDRLGEDECQALPTAIRIGSRWHMLFCYRQASDFRTNRDRAYRIGYAWSDDGSDWKRDDDMAGIDVTPGSWDSDMLCYPHLFRNDDKVYLLYNGNEFGRHGFGAAVLS